MAHNTPKKSNKVMGIIAGLSALGALISGWQTQMFFQTRSGLGQFHSFCNINATFDCTTIEMSRYAELWQGYPLSGLAIAGYLVIFLFAVMGFMDQFKHSVRRFLILTTALAAMFSVIYLGIMIGLIGKLCLFCLMVDAINISLLVLSFKLPNDSATSSLKITHIAGVGVTALFMTLLISKALDPQAEIKKDDLNDMVESVMATSPIALDLPADSPVIGPADAPVTIVKFSDFQCPGCKMAAGAIHPLIKRYPNQVKFVFINYPLDSACNPEAKHRMHPFACEAATVAICANAQGKYLEAYEILFEHQRDFADGKIADLVSKIPGINMEQLRTCMTQPSTIDKIHRDVALGGVVKVNVTPTFFVNGKKVEGGLPTSLWIQVIDQLLKK